MNAVELESELKKDNEAFENLREDLIKKYPGKWITLYRGNLVSIGDTYDESAAKARKKFGDKPMVTRILVPKGEERYWIL
ncbi:MAG: DUF5678 domain-containing protein [Methanosarcinales archaeon]